MTFYIRKNLYKILTCHERCVIVKVWFINYTFYCHGGDQMIYFTSDLHLGHQNALRLCNRPFQDVDEMNRTLIQNWNQFVKKNDFIYILGDLTMKLSLDEANQIISKLNGRKILVKGNHDKKYDECLFEEVCDYKELKYQKKFLVLSHYPFLEWNHSFRGSIHLHGHQHNDRSYNLKMREEGIYRYDVGVDAHEYRPVSIDEIFNFFHI